jgi:hypothetical protein
VRADVLAGRWRSAFFVGALACLAPAAGATIGAQQSPVHRALDLEDASRWEEAAALYRESLRGSESVIALFGLERALITLDRGEELAAVLGELVRERPGDEIARAMYVRTLLRLERREAARVFVQQWIGEQPQEPEAYRQLYAIAPLNAGEVRALWRRVRGRGSSPEAHIIADELTDHALSAGLWSVAREILEERYTRERSHETAEQLALVAARAGDVDRAATLIASAQATSEWAARGWIALYEGDFTGARRLLARADEADAAAVLPLAVVSRATVERAPEFGAALLRLVRGDTAAAVRAFPRAAQQVAGAESLVLAWAARLYSARGDDAAALSLYEQVVASHPSSPEAPEAVLAQARALLRHDRREEAGARLEHLILTYPTSALVPIARRELDALRGLVPPS